MKDNFDLKKFLTENKLTVNSQILKEVNMADDVNDFFINLSNNQKPKVQRYDWREYLNKIGRLIKNKLEKNFSDDFKGHQEFISALNNSEEHNQWENLYDIIDNFMNTEQPGKEIKLNNGAILFLIPRNDKYGGESMVPKEFIIRK
jgi:hypothetical protein